MMTNAQPSLLPRSSWGTVTGCSRCPKRRAASSKKQLLKAPQWETTDDAPGQPESPGGQHADYEAHISYQCWSPEHLTWLEPSLLDKLRNVTEARLNITTPRGQQSEVATSGHAHIALQ